MYEKIGDKMIGWIIYNKQDANENKSYIEWFILEAKKQGIDLQLKLRHELVIGIENGKQTILYQNKKITKPHFVVIRTIEPFLQLYFEQMAIPVFNNYETAKICNDKATTYMEMNALQVPVVPSYFIHKAALPKSIPFPFPFILKQTNGRGGKEVFFIHNEIDWEKAIEQCANHALVLQSANVILGRDVRVFIIGKEIIAAVLRKNDTDFRANFKLGGTAERFELNKRDQNMIMKIVERFDFGLVGIDFLVGTNGELFFNEIEDVVGSRILSETTDINLLQKYVQFIKRRVEKQ